MKDDERDAFLNEMKRLEGTRTEDKTKPKVMTAEEYVHEMRLYGDTPKDQFSHQFKLLFHPQSPPRSQMDLLPPDAILGLVKDSKTLMHLQKDNEILNRLFDMGNRNKGIMDLFDSLFYSWWQQMRMTGILGGNERWLQSFLEPRSVSYEGFTFWEKQKAKKANKQQGIANIMKQMQSNIEGKTYV